MILHDFKCYSCGNIKYDVPCSASFHKECECGAIMDIFWHHMKRPHIGIHAKDRAVVWYDPKTGKHATPGLNNVPMPERYRKAGYERKEFTTLRELDSFCKANNLVNHKAHYNGSGRAYDDVE